MNFRLFLLLTIFLSISNSVNADFHDTSGLSGALLEQYGEKIIVVQTPIEDLKKIKDKKSNKSALSSFDKNIIQAYALKKDNECSLFLKQPENNDLQNYYKSFNILNTFLKPEYQSITKEDLYTMIYVHEATHCRQVQIGGETLPILYQQYINEVDSDMAAYYWAVINGRLDLANFWLYSRMLSFSKNIDFRHNTASALADFAHTLSERRIEPRAITVDQFYASLNDYENNNHGVYSYQQFTRLLTDLKRDPTIQNNSYLLLQKDLSGSVMAMFGTQENIKDFYQNNFIDTWLIYESSYLQ